MTKKKKNFFLDEIISIENVGPKETYDFKIPKTHCFFANNILIHNSGFIEEGADFIILLHWPFHYSKNGDKNKFTLNVAKNRNGRTGWIDIRYKPENYWFYEEIKEQTDWNEAIE